MVTLTLTDVLAVIGASTGVAGLYLQWRLAGAVVDVRLRRKFWANHPDIRRVHVVIVNRGRQPVQVTAVGFTGPGGWRHKLPHRPRWVDRWVHKKLGTWRYFHGSPVGHGEVPVDVPFVLAGLSSQVIEFDLERLRHTYRDVLDGVVRPLVELGNGHSKVGPRLQLRERTSDRQ
jgi:hypothetical protein